MNCFHHPDRPAVGICKSCGRGLCPACAAAMPDGLACRGACEGRVRLLNRIVDSNERVLSAANAQVKSSGLFILLMGVVFCLFGFLPLALHGSTSTLFIGILGVCFALYGALRLLRRSQYYPTSDRGG